MDIFGIGPMELMLILIVALVVFGPGKLPEIGAKLGSSLREMRKATREFSREIDETRQAIEGPINDMKAPMQELAEPFQEAGTAVAGARDVLSNPSKAIEGYVMGQYASADKPAKSTADVSPPAHPAESADVLAAESVAADAAVADADAETDAVTAEATTETEAPSAEAAADETVVVESEPAVVESDAVAAEPAADAVVAASEAAPVEPTGSETTSGEMAVPPAPGVVSAIAVMESAFANATSSENVAWAGEATMAHKMPEAAEVLVVAAASEVAAPESPATTSPEPMMTVAPSDAPTASAEAAALPDVAASASEPLRVPAPSTTVAPVGQAAAGLPPPQPADNAAVGLTAPPVAARNRHRSAPRKSASPGPQLPPGEDEAPSSDTPASQD